MKPIIIKLKKPWLGKYAGITLFPFVLFYYGNKSEKRIKKILNHESIHIQQQLEMLVIPFYIVYGFFYLWNFISKFTTIGHDEAYRQIPFEIEAYENDDNLDYLKERKFWAWTKYVGKKKR